MGCHGWATWRSSANGVGNVAEHRENSDIMPEKKQGAIALALDLAKAVERVSLPVVWAWATHFNIPRIILRVLCGYFERQPREQFEGCVAGVACHCALCCRTH